MGTGFFFNLMSMGHVNPTLGVVTELVRHGERIIYYAFDEYRDAIEGSGAEFRSYPLPLPMEPTESGAHLALLKLEQSRAALPIMMEIVAREQPGYLMFDAMGTLGPMIGRTLGIPVIASNSSIAFTPEVIRALTPPGMRPEQLIEMTAGAANPHHLARYTALSREIEAMYGLITPGWIEMLALTGDLTLLYTSAAMHPAAELLDESYLLVGPCLRPSVPVEGFPYEVLERENLIYTSLGTVFNDNAAFYQNCLETFGDSQYHLLLSIGNQVAADALGAIPSNVTITRFAPQLDILRAARLFVTHGGMNSVHEALFHGVPLVVLPQGADQRIVAGQVVANGAGMMMESASLTPGGLRQAVEQVLTNPSFRRNAIRVGESLRAAGGAARAADEIMAYVARRAPVAAA